MKTKHHIQRITAAIVLSVVFIWLVTVINERCNDRNFYLWIGLLCVGYHIISYLIIAFDQAHDYPEEFISKEESEEIKEICRSVPYSSHEIFRSYKILKSFDLVRRAAELSIYCGEDFIHISNTIAQCMKKPASGRKTEY